MPEGAIILRVDQQGLEICLWAEIDTNDALRDRRFEVFGTGADMVTGDGITRAYINTFLSGRYVFHVYERLT